MKILKEKKGITLIALVITIIVLLILAGVTLSLVLGDNGVVTKADEAKTTSNQKEVEEQLKLKVQEYLANNDGEFNRSGFLSTLTEFTNNGDNTVTKDGVTLSIGTKGEVAIVNNNGNNYGTLTKSWDISENQDGSIMMDYYSDTKTVVVSGGGEAVDFGWYGDSTSEDGRLNPMFLFIGLQSVSDMESEEFMNSHYNPETEEITYDYPVETVIIKNNVNGLGYATFAGCDTIKNLIVEEGVETLGDSAFWCNSLENVQLPNSFTTINDHLFEQAGIVSIEIPNSVTRVGKAAFRTCGNLTSMTIPNSITSISEEMFEQCYKLEEVIMPNTITSIGNRAFMECYTLESITIPNNVTSIGSQAFGSCNHLINVLIPDSVISIGNYAFTDLPQGSIIYCETQRVADLLTSNNYASSKTTVIVDASKF